MPNPHRYFVEERKDGEFAVIGEGNDRAARVLSKLVLHYR